MIKIRSSVQCNIPLYLPDQGCHRFDGSYFEKVNNYFKKDLDLKLLRLQIEKKKCILYKAVHVIIVSLQTIY